MDIDNLFDDNDDQNDDDEINQWWCLFFCFLPDFFRKTANSFD